MTTYVQPTPDQQKESWTQWLNWYIAKFGAESIYDSLIRSIQGARSVCSQCGQPIYCDIVEGGGVPDWKTEGGDYGCWKSPDTNDDGTGGHMPERG